MIWWLAFLSYVVMGACLTPRFVRASYEAEYARYPTLGRARALREAGFYGWGKSLIWPVFLVIDVAVSRITAEERAELAEKEAARTVEGARAVIARFEAEEKRKWDSNFRNGGLS